MGYCNYLRYKYCVRYSVEKISTLLLGSLRFTTFYILIGDVLKHLMLHSLSSGLDAEHFVFKVLNCDLCIC